MCSNNVIMSCILYNQRIRDFTAKVSCALLISVVVAVWEQCYCSVLRINLPHSFSPELKMPASNTPHSESQVSETSFAHTLIIFSDMQPNKHQHSGTCLHEECVLICVGKCVTALRVTKETESPVGALHKEKEHKLLLSTACYYIAGCSLVFCNNNVSLNL